MKRSGIKRSPAETIRDWQRRSKKIRQRSFAERRRDDPDVYGDVFDTVRRMSCVGVTWDPRHRCAGPGRATAHHDPPVGRGGTDLTGLLPVCGFLHTGLHGSVNRTRKETLAELGITEERLKRDALAYSKLGAELCCALQR